MELEWINEALPLLRCPDTHQPLRLATPEDLRKHGHPSEEKALVREDGSRLYSIDNGIPILLPKE
jgi:uncharacterized protein YbaR (Trm112 family)